MLDYNNDFKKFVLIWPTVRNNNLNCNTVYAYIYTNTYLYVYNKNILLTFAV